VIRINGISKTFKEGLQGRKVQALDDLSLSVEKGEVFGFLGPNGAGKSTTIKTLMNLIFPDTGKATINGMDVGQPQARSCVGYLPENPYFYDYLTAEELLRFGGQAAGMSAASIRERSELLLGKVDLLSASRRQLRTYSKGMVQRAGLALALVHNPEVVILDEPMSGLDPVGRKMVGDLIVELKEQGKTVFFSSHILNDVERFCDRFGIIVGGLLRRVEPMTTVGAGKGHLEELFMQVVEQAAQGGAA